MIKALTKASLPLATIALLGACASKESFNSAREINEECQIEMQAARTAVRLRDQGKPKSVLQQQLPPVNSESSRLLINLHDIVTETFQYTSLNEVIYPTYRFELCLRQLQNKAYPASLAAVEQPLLACQQQYALQSSRQSTECVQQAMDLATPQPQVKPINRSSDQPESSHGPQP